VLVQDLQIGGHGVDLVRGHELEPQLADEELVQESIDGVVQVVEDERRELRRARQGPTDRSRLCDARGRRGRLQSAREGKACMAGDAPSRGLPPSSSTSGIWSHSSSDRATARMILPKGGASEANSASLDAFWVRVLTCARTQRGSDGHERWPGDAEPWVRAQGSCGEASAAPGRLGLQLTMAASCREVAVP
jgi:hypothetical protein